MTRQEDSTSVPPAKEEMRHRLAVAFRETADIECPLTDAISLVRGLSMVGEALGDEDEGAVVCTICSTILALLRKIEDHRGTVFRATHPNQAIIRERMAEEGQVAA